MIKITSTKTLTHYILDDIIMIMCMSCDGFLFQ